MGKLNKIIMIKEGIKMSIEYGILLISWIVTIISLFIFVPKNKVRVAHAGFLFKQVMTWIFGLIVVEIGLIEYPVRIFKSSNRTSFTFEFFIYPAICAIFNVHYPTNKSVLYKLNYYILYTSFITIFEVILEAKTSLIVYIHWSWYWTWITIFITFLFSRLYVKWFFRLS